MEDPIITYFRILIALILIIIAGTFVYKYSVDSIDNLEKEVQKNNTFLNHQIITVNNDTIKGDFYLQEKSGIFTKRDSYYINLKDSTRYNSTNVVSIKKIIKN